MEKYIYEEKVRIAMKKYTNKELKSIIADLKSGTVYCGVRTDGYGVGKISYDRMNYICWQHYGSSAAKCTVANLKFLVENIFKDCELITPAEYSEYHIAYVPVDKRYKGFDYSTSHPNVYGL